MTTQELIAYRDSELSESFWTVFPDAPITETNRGEWQLYRYNLMTLDVSNADVQLPTKPDIIPISENQDDVNKAYARMRIAAEVGDDRDLIADLSKRTDLLERGLVRLLAHVLGGTQMTDEYRQRYLAYAEQMISLVENGLYVPRADLEDEATLVERILSRQNEIAAIVKTEYLDKL